DEPAEPTGVLSQDGAKDGGHHDDERARRQPTEQCERHPEKPELPLAAGHQAGQVEGGQAAQHRETDPGQAPPDGEQQRPRTAPPAPVDNAQAPAEATRSSRTEPAGTPRTRRPNRNSNST